MQFRHCAGALRQCGGERGSDRSSRHSDCESHIRSIGPCSARVSGAVRCARYVGRDLSVPPGGAESQRRPAGLKIVDARPQINANGQRAIGYGCD